VPKPIAYWERDRIIEDTARGIWPMAPPRWTRFLSDEYDWIQDHGLVDLDGYLAADRTGRRLGLQADRRAQVFSAYERYRAELDLRNREDWSGMALRLWRKVERREVRLPGYDYIYVDEAQFFAPVWFHTLRAALSPSGRIFMAADPTQGFLKRRQSWTASGFDLRGRSTRLRRSYRNARPILEFAAAFYRSRLDDEDLGDLNLPEEEELASAPPGERAQFISVTSRQDEVNRVINEIRAFLGGGGNPAAILVLTALGKSTAEVANRLRHALGSEMICDARLAGGAGKIRICALDGATGLEAAIVFIVGAAEMLEAENDLQLPVDQRAEMIRDNTRRLYMGFTRAGMRLVITWHGSLPAWSSTP
jgi:superfamily I DNA/RNA helicase